MRIKNVIVCNFTENNEIYNGYVVGLS